MSPSKKHETLFPPGHPDAERLRRRTGPSTVLCAGEIKKWRIVGYDIAKLTAELEPRFLRA